MSQQIIGDLAFDDRGFIRFVNDFDFKKVKRFYQVENFSEDTIRAFHGHKREGKYVYVSSGSIILCYVAIDDFKKPSKENTVQRTVLSARKPRIVFVPPGFANGFKSLEPNTSIIFFSTSTLEQSKNDDFRYPFDYWGDEIWKVENR
jgi:dTDP-4-dehydrorhamnose 3,5-epimerase-like enzyme